MLGTSLLINSEAKKQKYQTKETLSNLDFTVRAIPEKNIAIVRFEKFMNSCNDETSAKQFTSKIDPNTGNSHISTDSTAFSSENQLRILVVEDNHLTQDYHKKILIDMGYVVHVAENAEQTIAMLHNSYDLVLLDIGLPDRNGCDVAKEIRNIVGKKLIIAAITINPNETLKDQCCAAGINYVFSKPLNREKINLIIGMVGVEKNKPALHDLYTEQMLLSYYATALKNAPKPAGMSKSQYFNYLAIQLLEEMGRDSPNQEAIDYVESFIKRYSRRKTKPI